MFEVTRQKYSKNKSQQLLRIILWPATGSVRSSSCSSEISLLEGIPLNQQQPFAYDSLQSTHILFLSSSVQTAFENTSNAE